MGMILDPTPDMGEYRVEVRRESFYLRSLEKGAGRHSILVYPDIFSPESGTVEILLEDIPKIRAALDQVERYLKLRRGDIPARVMASRG